MMKQMGMSQEDIVASEILIKTETKTYKFLNPGVQKVTMKGETTFQISGNFTEEENKFIATIDEDDVKTVSEQAGVSIEDARKALENTNGDIAQAIVDLS